MIPSTRGNNAVAPFFYLLAPAGTVTQKGVHLAATQEDGCSFRQRGRLALARLLVSTGVVYEFPVTQVLR